MPMIGERNEFASGAKVLSTALLPMQDIDLAQIFSLNTNQESCMKGLKALERDTRVSYGLAHPLYPYTVYLVRFNELSTFQFSDLKNGNKYTLKHNGDSKGFHTLNLVILDYYNVDNELANFVYNKVVNICKSNIFQIRIFQLMYSSLLFILIFCLQSRKMYLFKDCFNYFIRLSYIPI